MNPQNKKCVKQEHCAYVINFLANTQKAGEMKNIITYMNEQLKIQPHIKLYNKTISAFAKNKDLKAMEEILIKMKKDHIGFDLGTWRTIIVGYCRVNNVEKAEEYLRKMEELNFEPNFKIYAPLFGAFVRIKNFKKIEQLNYEIERKGIPYHPRFASPIIDYYVKTKNFEEAEKILTLLRNIYGEDSNYCFRTLLIGYSEEGKTKEALRIYYILKERGDHSDAVFSAMITLYSKIGEFEQAHHYLDLMKSFVNQQTTLEGIVRGYNIILHFLGRHKKVEQIRKLLNDMQASNINLDQYSYGAAICALAHNNLLIDAEQVLSQMIHNGFAPNPRSLNPLLLGYANTGDSEGFFNFIEKMKKFGISFDLFSYTAMVIYHINDNNLAKAEETITDMKTKSKIDPDIKIYIPLIQYYCKRDDNANLYRILKDCITLVDQKLILLLVGHFTKNHFDGLDSFLSFMKDNGKLNIWVYNALLAHFVHINDFERFDKYFNVLLDSNLKFDFLTYSAVVMRYLNDNQMEIANEWAKKMLDAGFYLVGILRDRMVIANDSFGIDSDYLINGR